MPSPSDPLEGLEQRPIETQVGVLANEVRNQRNALGEVKEELRYVKRALWSLVATIVIGLVVFQLTTARQKTAPVIPANAHITKAADR